MTNKKQPITQALLQAIATCSLSRYELAKRASVSESVLCRFVNHKQGITLDTADRLSVVLGLRLVSPKQTT